MLIAYLSVLYALWCLYITIRLLAASKWTTLRYLIGATALIAASPDKVLGGLGGEAGLEALVASAIAVHIAGALLCPAIFLTTILPVLLLCAAGRDRSS